MSLSMAEEISKAMKPMLDKARWVVPKPGWKIADLISQCSDDPMAVGGVIVTFYTGSASHFYLLYQAETQTFNIQAQIVSCNHRAESGHVFPTVVGVIAELPNSHGTPWIVRRTQVSIPIISFAGVAALLSPKAAIGKAATTTEITTAAVFSALFGQAATRDIPGYSDPLKLRYGTQEVGVDLVRAMRDLCTADSDLPSTASRAPRDKLCTYLGFALDRAESKKQQQELDEFEKNERNSR